MKQYFMALFGFFTVALAVISQGEAPVSAARSLAGLVPAGPLLYLEARDFGSLLRDWDASSVKQVWLEGDSYQVFSRSRLFLRLHEAQGEFAGAAGLPPDMSLLESVAGGESALALYDIGSLEFLYVTHMPGGRAVENALGRARGRFEPRQAAGLAYYIRTEPSKHRVVAFATTEDYLLLATREDLLAEALTLFARQSRSTLEDERWFADAVRAAGPAGDLRLALNMETMLRAPHFRSYWVQRNVSDLHQYTAEVADVHRSLAEIREDRVLLRVKQGVSHNDSTVASTDEAALAGVLRLIPDDAGLYRAWANPPVNNVIDLLERKILAPHVGPAVVSRSAPAAVISGEAAGSEADLESRIDVPPLTGDSGAFAPEALRKLLEDKKLQAALQLQSMRGLPGDVFVGTQSVVVLEAPTDWDGDAARSALLASVASLWTTPGLGAKWVERRQGDAAYFELNGLAHLAVANRGHFLIVANGSESLVGVLSRMVNAPAEKGGAYAAGFRHRRERDNFVKMLRLIETPFAQRLVMGQEPGGHAPLFFSENLASLSRALSQVESASILVRDQGPLVLQTVTYRLSR